MKRHQPLHERPSSSASQIAIQIQNPSNWGVSHPCTASSSTDTRPGHSNLHYSTHPNFRQHWKQCSSPPERGKFSEASLKGFEDSQNLSRLSFPPFSFSQETNQQVPGFGSEQYPISADYRAPEFKPDSSFINHTSFTPTQHAIPTGPFSDISIPHDYQQSIPEIVSDELQNHPRSEPIPEPSQDTYSGGHIDSMHFSDSVIAQPIYSQAEYLQDHKKPWKRRITEKRREQNRVHQKAFRLRRDLLLKNKDSEINVLEERLHQYKVENAQQREEIINLKAQLRSSEYMRSGKLSTDSVQPTTSHGLIGECLHSDQSLPLVENIDIHERPKFFPSEKFTTSGKNSLKLRKNQSNQMMVAGSSTEPARKSLGGGLSTKDHQSEESFFPWASPSPIYVPAQNLFNPNTREEYPKSYNHPS